MRFHRLLLHLYPRAFVAEYGDELETIFAQRRREASGPMGRLGLYLITAVDTLASAAACHGDIVRQDLRYAVRALRRSPGFALTAVLLAALGVGANAAAFSVADLVFIRSLPYPEADRLVTLWQRPPGYDRMELSPANYRDWARMNTSFASIGAFTFTSLNLVGVGEPVRLAGYELSPGALTTLGVQPMLGRLFAPSDAEPSAPMTVILSFGLWQTQFGGDVGVIGRRVLLDGVPHIVSGVMPRTFQFPRRDVKFWIPLRLPDAAFVDRADNYLQAIGRLRPGVTLEQARAEMTVIAARLERAFPKENEHTGAGLFPLRDEVSGRSSLLLMALCGAALCILLIGCANLASLHVARSVARGKEMAVRSALGAGRERLVRQLATESLLLAVVGGACGLALAFAALPLLGRLVPASLPIAGEPAIDGRVLLVASVLTVVTGIAFGVLPAWRSDRRLDLAALRDGARAGGGRRERIRAALVITEVTGTLVLLVSCGLLMRAIWRLQATDPGFRAEGVFTMRTALPSPRYDSTARRDDFFRRVLDGVKAIPGVTSAAYTSYLPMTMGGGIWPVGIGGEEVMRSAGRTASLRFVTPGYFGTMGIALRKGRDVAETDASTSPFVAVVSESFARHFFPNVDAMGRRFRFGPAERTIVGIVGDIRVRGLEIESEPQVYLPSTQQPDGALAFYTPKDLAIRSTVAPAVLVPAARAIIAAADPDQPISNIRSLGEIVALETASRALQLRLLGVLAAIAIVLAGVGIHGLLAFTVSHRAQELGVRMALGARGRDVVAMVVRQGLGLAAAGVVLGVVIAYGAARAMDALLAGVRPGDPVTFAAAIALALVMAVLGSLVPAWRASRVDPISVIRAD